MIYTFAQVKSIYYSRTFLTMRTFSGCRNSLHRQFYASGFVGSGKCR